MRLPLVLALVLPGLAFCACSGSSATEAPGAGGGSGSGGSSPVSKKAPGEACQDAKECACILCSCDNGGVIAEACDTDKLVCAGGADMCKYGCTYNVLGGQKGVWTGESSVVECPAYGGLSLGFSTQSAPGLAWSAGR